MAVLQVLHIPDERLRIVAEPVKEVNAEIQRIVDDMFDTMYAEEGIGPGGDPGRHSQAYYRDRRF